MPEQTFNDPVVIDSGVDEPQLTIRGSGDAGSEQTSPLQNWQTSDAVDQARITGDGRFQIGTFSGGAMATDDALIEAHRSETDTSKPKRGMHLLGAITDPLTSIISWIVQELVLKGTSGISALHTALRVRLTNENTGDMTGAELLGGDIEVSNAGGHSSTNGKVPMAAGLRVGLTNQSGGYLQTGVGLQVEMANLGVADTLIGIDVPDVDEGTDNYALRTGAGKVQLGELGAGLVKSNVNGLVANVAATTDPDVEMVGATTSVDGATGLVPQPVAGDEAKFLRGDGTWATPAGGGGGASALGDLSDVDTTGATTNDVLTFDGTEWIPQAPSGGGGSHTHTVSEITDAGNMAYQNKANVDIDGGDIEGVDIDAGYIAADDMEVDWARFTELEVENDTWSTHNHVVASNSAYHSLNIKRARGTLASPTAVQDGDTIGQIEMQAYDGSSYADGPRIRSVAKSNWSGGTDREANLEFYVADATTQHRAGRFEEHGAFGLADVISTPGSASGWSKLWSDTGELKVKDASGNTTTLSSHNPQLVDVSERPTSYVHVESNPFTGHYIEIDVYKTALLLEALTGQQLIHVAALQEAERMDWQSNEEQLAAEQALEIQQWEATPPEKRVGKQPLPYSIRPEPSVIAAARNWTDSRPKSAEATISALEARLAALEVQIAGS